MKFAHYIQGLERDCPPEWRGRFIKYVLRGAYRCWALGLSRHPEHLESRQWNLVLSRYKDLKKLLKPCTSADGQAHVVTCTPCDKAQGGDTHPAEDVFFSALQEQMVEVDRCGARV